VTSVSGVGWDQDGGTAPKNTRAMRNRLSDLGLGSGSGGGFPTKGFVDNLRVLLSHELVRLAAALHPLRASQAIHQARHMACNVPESRAHDRIQELAHLQFENGIRARWRMSDGFEPIRRYRRYHRLIDRSPRLWLHACVDDLPWWWTDASDINTIDLAGVPPGPHKIVIDLMNAKPRGLPRTVQNRDVHHP